MADICVHGGAFPHARFVTLAKAAAAEERLNPTKLTRRNPGRKKRAGGSNLHRTRARLDDRSETSSDSERENDDAFAPDDSSEGGEAANPTPQRRLLGAEPRKVGRPRKTRTYFEIMKENPGVSTAAAASIETVLFSGRSALSAGSGSTAPVAANTRRSSQRAGGAQLGSTQSSTKTLPAAEVAAGLQVARRVTPARSAKKKT